jgi:hypothetical protein
MKTKNLIAIKTVCSHYDIESSFIDSLHHIGLIQIERIQRTLFIHEDQISDLEKMIRLHHELNVNPEGIDVVFNLLQKERELRDELIELRNRLRLYERE